MTRYSSVVHVAVALGKEVHADVDHLSYDPEASTYRPGGCRSSSAGASGPARGRPDPRASSRRCHGRRRSLVSAENVESVDEQALSARGPDASRRPGARAPPRPDGHEALPHRRPVPGRAVLVAPRVLPPLVRLGAQAAARGGAGRDRGALPPPQHRDEPGARRARDGGPAAGDRRRRQPLDRAGPRRLDALGRGGPAVGHRRRARPAAALLPGGREGRAPLRLRARSRARAVGEVRGDGRAVVRLGEGPKGETVVFDSEDAITLFNQKHGRPRETFPPKATVAGPGNLRVPTLADRLVEASPQSRVVVVSGKDRTTVFLAGRDRRHVAYWYDQETGRFVTSSAYDTFGLVGSAGRALVSRFNAQKAGSQVPVRFGTLWERLPAPASRVGFGDPALPAPGLHDVGLPAPHERPRLPPRPAALRARVLLRRLRQPARGRAHRGPGGGLRRRRDLPAGPRRGAGRADDRLLRPGRRVSQLRERVGGEPRHDPPSRPADRPRLRRARASPAPGLVRRRDVGRPRLRGHPRGGEGPRPPSPREDVW